VSFDPAWVQALRELCLRVWPELQGLWVFGSRVTGAARPDSDLDLALLLPGRADAARLWEVSGELARLAGCDVDLLDLRAASTVMAHQVLSTGHCWHARQPDADSWVAFVLSEKLALDAARAPLMAQIQQEGKIYGR
jgi:predicted nucleotidyltransferase